MRVEEHARLAAVAGVDEPGRVPPPSRGEPLAVGGGRGAAAPAAREAQAVDFERDTLRDRVRAGIAQARLAGKRFGRPPVVRGKQCRDVRRLSNKGVSKRGIAAELGISRTSVAGS